MNQTLRIKTLIDEQICALSHSHLGKVNIDQSEPSDVVTDVVLLGSILARAENKPGNGARFDNFQRPG